MKIKQQNGFTIMELMIVLMLIGVLAGMALPGFKYLMQTNKAATQANSLLTALMLARSEAVKAGVDVSVCSSTDLSGCSASTAWENGWIVIDNNDVVIRVWAALPGGSSVAGPNTPVIFKSAGNVNAAADFALTTPNISDKKCINVLGTGRASIKTQAACP